MYVWDGVGGAGGGTQGSPYATQQHGTEWRTGSYLGEAPAGDELAGGRRGGAAVTDGLVWWMDGLNGLGVDVGGCEYVHVYPLFFFRPSLSHAHIYAHTYPQGDPGAVQRQEVRVRGEHGVEVFVEAGGGDEGVGL